MVLKALEGRKYRADTPIYRKAIEWVKCFPSTVDVQVRLQLIKAIREAFEVSESEIYAAVEGIELSPPPISTAKSATSSEQKLEALLPKGGWFEWYTAYTRETESPLSYHLFSSLCVLSAAIGRRVVLDMGFFRVYPNMAVVLVGPTGLVKKTSAVEIAKKIIEDKVLCPILAEQLNASVIISALAKRGGTQLLYIPEVANTFTKEQFNSGLVTRLLRLLDCPDRYEAETQIRGIEVVENVALTVLGGTTPDQITDSMPKEVIQSGFLNRFIWVVEQDTERCCPKPRKGPNEAKILMVVERMKALTGTIVFKESGPAWDFYTHWYEARKDVTRKSTELSLVRATQRYDTHLLKLAILINLVEYDSFELKLGSLELASKLIDYVDMRMGHMVKFIEKSPMKQDTDRIVDMLKRMGGIADHSSILRRLSGKFTSTQFKSHINTLAEQGIVQISKRGIATCYILKGQEDGNG